MIYSRNVVYALKALGYLAGRPLNRLSKVHEMAEELEIPRHYLGKILTELVKRKLVVSVKGPSGGFALAKNPAEISLYAVLSELGGITRLEKICVMGLGECTDQTPCAMHDYWREFKTNSISEIQKLTLADFSQTFRKKREVKPILNAGPEVSV